MRLFALGATRDFGEAVARALGRDLDPLEEREFEDREHKARPMVGVRGADAYVIQSLHGSREESPNDKLCRLLFFLGALRTNGAARITAVIPYLAYARKDRQTKPRDPLTARYIAELIEAMGATRVVAMEVHNPVAYQNAFRIETVALDLRGVLLDRATGLAGDGPVAVSAPDPGGVKRAQLFREALEARLDRAVGFALMEKRRSAGVVSGSLLAGEVEGARVLVVDDMVASGQTMTRAAEALRSAGAAEVWALAAHGLFTEGAEEALADPRVAGWIVTDTVPPFRIAESPSRARVEHVSAAPLFGEVISRLAEGGSLSDLISGDR